MKMFIAALSVLICVFSDTQAIAQTQSALLIGINVYQPEDTQVQHPAGCTSGRCELPHFENLSGADNDAQAMQSTKTFTEQRWIYVLDINCQGQGELPNPIDNTDDQFPRVANCGRHFVSPGSSRLSIVPPCGVDTFILLSTAEPLPDPYVLNFEGVASRDTRGMESPLQKLLTDTSSSTRGPRPVIPTNWGINITTVRSVPKEADK
ncbi:MAG TPA: hypothetical protein VGE85_03125 [Terracidiphilus sp.]|jgi:hypothetical protein